jgi:subtilisin family serine protease
MQRKAFLSSGIFAALVASGIFATPAVASGAAADFVHASRPAGGGSFIVSLAPGVASASATASTLAERYGGDVEFVFTAAMRGFHATGLSDAQARGLAADPAVRKVFQDGTATAADTQNNATWGLDRTDQRDLPLDTKYTYTGSASNVTVYVTDTGIRTSLSEFEGRASVGADFVGDGQNGIDCSGHGTHVSGTIAGKTWGVAKGAKLVSVRMLGESCGNSAPDSAGVRAIEWVTRNAVKPAVVNASWTFDSADIGDEAIAGMLSSGVQLVAASGNSATNACGTGPANVPEIVTVNATSRTDARASFSNFGACTDIFAPGDGITSSSLSEGGSAVMSGTSMASPHVAGVAALYLSANPSASPQALRDALVAGATDGKVTNAGSGSPNKLLYSGFLSGGPEPQPCAGGANGADVAIPDNGTAVTSPVSLSDCAGGGTATTKVKVDIVHTYTADLDVALVGPSGREYVLRRAGGIGTSSGVHETYTVDTSAETRNGTWRLAVTDVYTYDTGTVDAWTLTF